MNLLPHSTSSLCLVTGPARSGKSEWAEALAIQSGRAVVYVATAQTNPNDPEWQARIERHRDRRPETWQTVQEPVELVTVIQQAQPEQCLLVDSLGTWLANLLEQDETAWEQTQQALLHSLQQTQGQIILVAEETGWGVVPAYPIGRTFRDRLGTLVRYIGAITGATYLVTGGYVLNLTQLGTPLSKALVESAKGDAEKRER
ncbi:bifunctional adenosylcobinamide kinase/adenosylcobinamide-phosphate guanylyltransferase [Trichocoleus sp. FACHB-262]|uniref:bifunctional adenosylcobinamide kinase/adenosylcobinamide-phosphate guanylyltransferase n=1 Tax=Trichocoleus sp. FACHB-262 TaxID=2692869 RepID=UPI001684C7BD|nr:bifunctional adenosylcobinamide kinase/adenosylcobinamide-phosphate guanylyltransferase [Trichocoleus sp. FACHB-262]MBD2120640.1 bifunctional adenosylcobinamide kinase/adenosylcobinamide-phosphate guanylyltransferase [Trichocoleus sp. FACHB-262]